MEINPETNYISQQPKNSHLAGWVYLSNSVTQKCHYEALAMLYLSVIFMYKKKKGKKASFSVILRKFKTFCIRICGTLLWHVHVVGGVSL